MPKDAAHTLFNFIVLIAILIILLCLRIYIPTVQMVLFTLSFIVGTVVLNPDLDTKSKAAKRCGIICGPYRMLTKHRGISHHPLWGVAARIAYFMVILLIAVWLFGLLTTKNINAFMPLLIEHPYELLASGAGLFTANILHIMLDKIT